MNYDKLLLNQVTSAGKFLALLASVLGEASPGKNLNPTGSGEMSPLGLPVRETLHPLG